MPSLPGAAHSGLGEPRCAGALEGESGDHGGTRQEGWSPRGGREAGLCPRGQEGQDKGLGGDLQVPASYAGAEEALSVTAGAATKRPRGAGGSWPAPWAMSGSLTTPPPSSHSPRALAAGTGAQRHGALTPREAPAPSCGGAARPPITAPWDFREDSRPLTFCPQGCASGSRWGPGLRRERTFLLFIPPLPSPLPGSSAEPQGLGTGPLPCSSLPTESCPSPLPPSSGF